MEMLALMQKQVTFIYRYVLTYIGFQGYVIDHFSIRNNPSLQPFIEIA